MIDASEHGQSKAHGCFRLLD
uniref:Uncharacterized protein n=1 Tax=Arundo donax TaxID=35708 RepID=A0A0A8XVJ9_ARUDO